MNVIEFCSNFDRSQKSVHEKMRKLNKRSVFREHSGFLQSKFERKLFFRPIIRFYPMILRYLAGDDCFQENRGRFVMGAVTVSEITITILFSIAQRYTQPVFWSRFMIFQTVLCTLIVIYCVAFGWEHGFFIFGMAQCALRKL